PSTGVEPASTRWLFTPLGPAEAKPTDEPTCTCRSLIAPTRRCRNTRRNSIAYGDSNIVSHVDVQRPSSDIGGILALTLSNRANLKGLWRDDHVWSSREGRQRRV